MRSREVATPSPDPPSRDAALDTVLTDGYARVLQLEKQRRDAERKAAEILDDAIAIAGEGSERLVTVSTLMRRSRDFQAEIDELRASLRLLAANAAAQRRFVREHRAARRPDAGRQRVADR